MSAINTVVYVIHLLSVIGILVLLSHQASLTALLAGIILVGLHNSVKPDEELDHIKVGIKFIFLLVILVLGYTNVKKPELPKNVWLTMLGLTITNVVIASWR
jgi:hypothetical protein